MFDVYVDYRVNDDVFLEVESEEIPLPEGRSRFSFLANSLHDIASKVDQTSRNLFTVLKEKLHHYGVHGTPLEMAGIVVVGSVILGDVLTDFFVPIDLKNYVLIVIELSATATAISIIRGFKQLRKKFLEEIERHVTNYINNLPENFQPSEDDLDLIHYCCILQAIFHSYRFNDAAPQHLIKDPVVIKYLKAQVSSPENLNRITEAMSNKEVYPHTIRGMIQQGETRFRERHAEQPLEYNPLHRVSERRTGYRLVLCYTPPVDQVAVQSLKMTIPYPSLFWTMVLAWCLLFFIFLQHSNRTMLNF